MSDATKKGELALRDKAALHQQRRLKQATLFTHKDSADLLPLDGLKRLGTSKDLQPHSIVQRRLMEGGAPGRLRGEARDAAASLARSPLADTKDGGGCGGGGDSESTADSSPEESERSLRSEEEEQEQEEERDGEEAVAKGAETEEETASRTTPPPALAALVVRCKCCAGDVRASIDTGCQHNHISSSCCRRLGLVPEQDSGGPPSRTVRGLELQLGSQRVQCSAYVKDDEESELCLGLETLLELKCCVDLSGRVLRLEESGEELPFLMLGAGGLRRHHDTNKNL